jgi:glucose-6-phosphate isomerase
MSRTTPSALRPKGEIFKYIVSDIEVQNIERVVSELKNTFEGVLIIGIGGSYLGPRTLVEALSDNSYPIYWLSQPDPIEIRRIENIAKQKKLCTVVISKSGNTIETLSAFFHLQKYLDPKGYIIITDPKKGTLRELAEKNKWLSFEVPPTVGGRYSVLTPVGFVPAAFAGINISRLLEGQVEMQGYLDNSKEENPALALAQYKYSLAEKGFSIQYFMPYLQCLKFFSEWYVQLFAESLGKELKGPTPVAALGPSDQHSILQLIKEGPKNKVVGFLDCDFIDQKEIQNPSYQGLTFEKLNHFACESVAESLDNSQIPNYKIQLKSFSEKNLAALFYFLEVCCAFSAELYGVDAYNQPGVEESKNLLKKRLSNDKIKE